MFLFTRPQQTARPAAQEEAVREFYNNLQCLSLWWLLFFKGASRGCSWEVFFYNTLMVTDHRSGSFKGTKRCSLFMGGRVLQHPPAILNIWCRNSFRLDSLCNVWWGLEFFQFGEIVPSIMMENSSRLNKRIL